MKSKEVLNTNAREILDRILKGESLTVLQEEYKIDKGTITDYYRDLFKEDKRALDLFDMVLEEKKKKTSTINVEKSELYKYAQEFVQKRISLNQIAKNLNIHPQTVKSKLLQIINSDENLKNQYEKNVKKNNYKDINFEEILIEMLIEKKTQAEIEEEYGLAKKTLSKKIKNLKDSDKDDLYKACKILGKSCANKTPLDNSEEEEINRVINKYTQKNNVRSEEK